MFYLNQSTPDALQKGMDYLHHAVETDPTDPLASEWTALWRACIYAALGETDAAFKWLEYKAHHAWTPWLLSPEWQIFIKPLHGDPRFKRLQRKMGVPEKGT